MTKPLAIDLFCGLGGWSEGLLAEGWDVVGFDNVQHVYGEHRYPTQLVVQDVMTLHGSQFRNADLIVASPPCQEYSYMAMPWSLGKKKAAAIRADATGVELKRLTALFDACFRIQREACEAAGRHIPMVVENVRGAQPWVGRARWMFGSFALWGDVPVLMPIIKSAKVAGLKGCDCHAPETTPSGFAAVSVDCPFHGEWNDGPTVTTIFPAYDGRKGVGPKWDPITKSGTYGMKRWTNPDEGIKQRGDWLNQSQPSISRMTSSKSSARKMASAMIAKIPEPLSRHIGRTFYPNKS